MTTTLVFIRHAQADDGDYPDDLARPLSDQGKETMRAMAQLLDSHDIRPNYILSSPYKRAVQCADIIQEVLPCDIEVQPAIAYDDFDEDFLIDRLNPPFEEETFFLVGHDPTLSDFAKHLVGADCLPTGLSKAACAVVEFANEIHYGTGELVACYTTGDLE